MTLKKRNLLGGINRFRLMLTLVLAVLVPAAALIYVNFSQLRSFQRDKFLQAAIHRDFQEQLAITEKRMSKKAYAKVDDVIGMFPSRKNDDVEKKTKLDEIFSKCACFDHALFFDGEDLTFETDPNQMNDRFVREEHDHMVESYRMSFESKDELKWMSESINKNPEHIIFSWMPTKRADGQAYMLTGFFRLPDSADDDFA